MRARIPALALCLLAAGLAAGPAAAAGSTTLFHGTPHDAVFDVDTGRDRGGATAWAVGAGGLVLSSADGGANWTRQPALGDRALLGVAAGAGTVLAVGQGGTIRRQDGDRWSIVESGTAERLFAVDVGAGGLAVAVGAFGTVLRSTDAGRSWQPVPFEWEALTPEGSEPHLYGVQVDGDRVVLVGEFGLVLRSGDGGRTWAVTARGEASLFDVTIDADGHGLAVGQKGVVARTADDGRSWSLSAVPSEALLGVWAAGPRAFAAGIRSAYASGDGGRSWTPVDRGDIATGWYQAVARGAGGLVMVGHGGRVVALDPFAPEFGPGASDAEPAREQTQQREETR